MTIEEINQNFVDIIKVKNKMPRPIMIIICNDDAHTTDMSSDVSECIYNAGVRCREVGGQEIVLAMDCMRQEEEDVGQDLIDKVESSKSCEEMVRILDASGANRVMMYVSMKPPFEKQEVWEQAFACTKDGPAIGEFKKINGEIPFECFLQHAKEGYENG